MIHVITIWGLCPMKMGGGGRASHPVCKWLRGPAQCLAIEDVVGGTVRNWNCGMRQQQFTVPLCRTPLTTHPNVPLRPWPSTGTHASSWVASVASLRQAPHLSRWQPCPRSQGRGGAGAGLPRAAACITTLYLPLPPLKVRELEKKWSKTLEKVTKSKEIRRKELMK